LSASPRSRSANMGSACSSGGPSRVRRGPKGMVVA
jgi:hypothetical protein